MQPRFYVLYIALCASFFVSCMTAPEVNQDKVYDYTTNGFLDDNHYQVTAISTADPSAKGLVAQRESALIKARNTLQEKTVNSLVQYCFSRYLRENRFPSEDANPKLQKVRELLRVEMTGYLKYGHITEEYYEKDNSAWVVLRIEKKDLRKSIESVQISLPEEKTGGE
jgi:hypothetical protein